MTAQPLIPRHQAERRPGAYDGTKITTVEDNTPTTREYDSLGDLVSVTDLAGTITYKLAADSQPISITGSGRCHNHIHIRQI